jgi:benzylsuccinate CoA-transferase BbsE subunit
MGPAAGGFTNNLFAWLREEGAVDERLAALDWRQVPDLVAAGEIGPDELDLARAAVARFLVGRTKRELMDASLQRKLLAAPIVTVADLAESPQLAARGFWVEFGEGAERRVLPGPFAHSSADAFAFRRPAPRLGEHNAEVCAEVLGAATT